MPLQLQVVHKAPPQKKLAKPIRFGFATAQLLMLIIPVLLAEGLTGVLMALLKLVLLMQLTKWVVFLVKSVIKEQYL
jgi:hypothetical protein